MARGAVVVIVSDGWEIEDPALVGRAMEQLSRLAFHVIWVNPRKAARGYRPLVGGMAAAMPYVDTFVSGHSLRALEEVMAAIRDASADGRRTAPTARSACHRCRPRSGQASENRGGAPGGRARRGRAARAHDVPLLDAIGQTLARDVVAPWPLPSFDNSSMDGYAVAPPTSRRRRTTPGRAARPSATSRRERPATSSSARAPPRAS